MKLELYSFYIAANKTAVLVLRQSSQNQECALDFKITALIA